MRCYLEVLPSQDSRVSEMISSRNMEDVVDKILKKLKEPDFISIFFLLMDFIPPKGYFDIINMERSIKENILKKILKDTREEEETLLQILAILQKNNLIRLLDSCKHKMKNKDSFDKISPLWKVMYDVCESITSTKDIKALKVLYSEAESCNYPEIIFVHAYYEKTFTDSNLSGLSSLFRNERPDISSKLDMYDGKVCNIKYYPIRKPTPCKPCGLAVIINHKNFWHEEEESSLLNTRVDSMNDVDALKKVWKKFGFQISVHNDLTDQEVIDLFQQLAKTDHSAYDIFICCYMSHGDNGVVFASNSKPISISYLVDIISNNCLTLLDKPKLFFIEACQGSQIQKGTSTEPIKLPKSELSTETNIGSNTPLYSDVLKVDSSIPGYTSFVADKKMSWFIESLVSKLTEYGKDLDIINIVIKVQEEVSKKKGTVTLSNEIKIENCKQTVKFESTLRSHVKLKHIQV